MLIFSKNVPIYLERFLFVRYLYNPRLN